VQIQDGVAGLTRYKRVGEDDVWLLTEVLLLQSVCARSAGSRGRGNKNVTYLVHDRNHSEMLPTGGSHFTYASVAMTRSLVMSNHTLLSDAMITF
jgi:hypothetical protein